MRDFPFYLLFCFFSLTQMTWAAPVAGTPSSKLFKSDENFFQSEHGFSISSKNTKWKLSPPSINNQNIQVTFVGKKESHHIRPSLTVRVNKLSRRESLSKYMSKWKKDYPKFGFNILMAKKIRLNKKIGLILDILDRKNQKKMRQLVFVKDKLAVVLSCRSHSAEFKTAVKSCNTIFKNFSWKNSADDWQYESQQL